MSALCDASEKRGNLRFFEASPSARANLFEVRDARMFVFLDDQLISRPHHQGRLQSRGPCGVKFCTYVA
jgi:hypothetical protein